jgi:hypothetical protein
MALTIPQIVEKLFDTVNAGKIITEVGAGLALAVPTLMLLSLASDISVLPADRGLELKKKVAAAGEQVQKEKMKLRPILADIGGPDIGDLSQYDGDSLESLARREIAARTAELEVYDAQIAALIKTTPLPKDEIQKLLALKMPLVVKVDRLVAQKDLVETAVERYRTAENLLEDSRSFANNMEVFTNNITATIAFSIVLGVVLSQVSRFLFVNMVFDKLIPRAKISTAEAVRRGWATQEAFDDLIRGYYRYTEGSINMVAPALMFGIVFPMYAGKRLPEINGGYLTVLSILAIGSAVVLVLTGFFTYREYRRRVNELCTPPAAAPAPRPGG